MLITHLYAIKNIYIKFQYTIIVFLVAEYANKIVHEFEGMAIVDITGSYATKVELSVYDISKKRKSNIN